MEATYGVEDVGWSVMRFQLAEYFGWSMRDIDEMTMGEIHQSYAYIKAVQRANGSAESARDRSKWKK